MPWRLEGTYFENCPCDMVCPCTTSGLTMPADAERCRVVLVFHIWRVGVFMDAAASQEQADKLGAVFSGQLGGPMEALSGLIEETLGVEVAPIEYEDEGRRHRVRIGEFAEIEIEDFVPPQTPEGEVSKLTGVFHPANSTLTMAQATTSRVNAFGLEFSHEGKNGHSAPFSWAA
jgi:hypothetical protein